MPLVGSSPSTTLMLNNAWNATIVVRPSARNAPKRSGARRAVRMPRQAMTQKQAMITVAPMNPSSSEMTEKMKSLCGSGRKSSFCFPSISPRPKMPPTLTAIIDWIIWYPST
jgi:hypothetical protein